MIRLPKDSRSQEIGRLAGRALGAKIPRSWVEKALDGDSDFGLDYIIQLKNNDNYVACSFYLQLKGTTVPTYNADKKHISYDFRVSSLEFYHQQEPLVMVAVVDLEGKEDKVWECPIYYFWLDDDWFYKNKNKIDNQEVISIKIPITQQIEQTLDIYPFYSKRIEEKFVIEALKMEIKPYTKNLVQSIGNLTKTISSKPVFLKAAENNGDEPWIENPEGEVTTLLKQCSDSLSANQLTKARKILSIIARDKSNLNSHELAELYFQEALMLSMKGEFLKATAKLKMATGHSDKDRYKLAYIESKFRLTELPSQTELIDIAKFLPVSDYRNAIVKAKCLALTGDVGEALNLLKYNFPDKISGQLIILMIAGNSDLFDKEISVIDKESLVNDRDKFIVHSCIARREYIKANAGIIVYDKIMPIQGDVNVNVNCMKEACINLVEAWNYAKALGYPSDILILLDISPFIFGYFNRMKELFYHFDQILSERPNHAEIIKLYSRVLSNELQYKKTIELLNRIPDDLDIADYGVLFISNYYLKRFRVALSLLKQHEAEFIEERPENFAFILCVGAEIAKRSLDDKSSEKYLEILQRLDSGNALIAVNDFVMKVSATPSNREIYTEDLYKEYVKLGYPVIIAEHLFRFLNPLTKTSATRIIELSENILSVHDMFESDYFLLAQSFETIGNFNKSLEIAEKQIDKCVFDPKWHSIKAFSLQKIGKIGLAYDDIKASLDDNRFSSEHLKQYVHICLQFGLFAEVEDALIDLLNSTENREDKLIFLSNLINIYSTVQDSLDKLTNAVKRFGQIVNRENSTEEGQFLIYCFSLPTEKTPQDIKEFQQRLENYSNKFPDSPIFKRVTLDLDGGPDKLLSSLNEALGITKEQLIQWEKNKNKIRSGSFPVPFVMLEKFLRDTRDLFSTWFFSKNTSEDHLEFKLHQSSQFAQEDFDSILSQKKSVIIEDSSLLILNDVGILECLLHEVDDFSLLESTFDRIRINNQSLAGSLYNSVAQEIMKVINKYKAKLRIISHKEHDIFEVVSREIQSKNSVFLTDDACFLRFVQVGERNLVRGNSFNIIEYLCAKTLIAEDEKYKLVSKVCSLGIREPNMNITLLADAFTFFISASDYTETAFKKIFDKVFSAKRNTIDVIPLFFSMLSCASKNTKYQMNAYTLLSLFRGILIRHQYKSIESFTGMWFVWQCMITKINSASQLIVASTVHVKIWRIYQEIMFIIKNKESTNYDLLSNAAHEIFLLDDESRERAYHNLKLCFTPMTEEYELLVKIYKEMAISRQLMSNFGD